MKKKNNAETKYIKFIQDYKDKELKTFDTMHLFCWTTKEVHKPP